MSSRKPRPAEKPRMAPPRGPVTTVAIDEVPSPGGIPRWAYAVAILLAAFIAFEVYGPALNGEFVFDDTYLPFMMPDTQNAPLPAWLGVRPLLMFSYWLNYQHSGLDPYPYHAVNIFLHVLNSALAWCIVRRLLGMVGETGTVREWLAGFAGALFLLHPVQTESVAYVASRSEAMSIFFFLAAYAVFVYRREAAISIPRALVVLLLFAIACTVKEHTTVLPGLLLLTDYFFTTPFRLEGIRRNLKLYAPILIGGAVAVAAVWRVLSTASSAGFQLREFTWYQYLFTQFRVIWTYLRLYVFPLNQNGDYSFPISHTITEHGAVHGLVALLAVSFIAWRYRRSFPLASFGWFGFLLLLAPTSSVIPIRDVIVERRLYLPFLCLLLITIDFVRRWRPAPAILASTLGVVVAVAGFASWQRNQVWANPLTFWGDVVAKSPDNSRAQFQLAYAEWQAGKCQEAAAGYEAASKLQKPDERLLVDWALALDCLNKTDEAVAKLQQANALAPSALNLAQIGMIYGKRNRFDESMKALDQAEKLDPRFDMTYVYKGNLFAARGDLTTAANYYRHALAINPRNEVAQNALLGLQRQGAQTR